MMYGVLGNFKGKVKPWYLPFDWVFCRISINYKTRVFIVKNKVAPNVYGLPVEVINGEVVKVHAGDIPLPILPIPQAPDVPQKMIFQNDYGELFATKNFSDVSPKWRKYKRMGWAVRYVNGMHLTMCAPDRGRSDSDEGFESGGG